MSFARAALVSVSSVHADFHASQLMSTSGLRGSLSVVLKLTHWIGPFFVPGSVD